MNVRAFNFYSTKISSIKLAQPQMNCHNLSKLRPNFAALIKLMSYGK